MKTIAVDLDNTIAIYDSAILAVCDQLKLNIPPIYMTKPTISAYLKSNGNNDIWTDIQGLIYGPYMKKAVISKGFERFAAFASKMGYKLIIVSHKTKLPASGAEYNLRKSAKEWLDTNLPNVFAQIYFEDSIESKVARVRSINPVLFIDDLKDILQKCNLGVYRSILINEAEKTTSSNFFQSFSTWDEIFNEVSKRKEFSGPSL